MVKEVLSNRERSRLPAEDGPTQFVGDLHLNFIQDSFNAMAACYLTQCAFLGLTVVSVASFVESTYRSIWKRSIGYDQYFSEIREAGGMIFHGAFGCVLQLIRFIDKLAYAYISPIGVVVCHGANKCAGILSRHEFGRWLPEIFTYRKELYRSIGRVVLSLLLCLTPLQSIGLCVLVRVLFSALISYFIARRIARNIGIIPQVSGSSLNNPILQALLTGCCKTYGISPFLGGGIHALSLVPFRSLSIWYTLLSMGVTFLCMALAAIYQIRQRPWDIHQLTQLNYLEILHYALLFFCLSSINQTEGTI